MDNQEARKICAMEVLPVAEDCCKRECPWCGYSCKRDAVTLPDVSDSLPIKWGGNGILDCPSIT